MTSARDYLHFLSLLSTLSSRCSFGLLQTRLLIYDRHTTLSTRSSWPLGPRNVGLFERNSSENWCKTGKSSEFRSHGAYRFRLPTDRAMAAGCASNTISTRKTMHQHHAEIFHTSSFDQPCSIL